MKIAKEDVPVRIDSPAAIARQKRDFGDSTGYGKMAGEFFTLSKGTDISPLLEGLEDNMCQSPHWGYVLNGNITVRYTNKTEENNVTGDLFYWPPGHTVIANEDSNIILFSPQDEHCHVVDHILDKMGVHHE
ncbi:hypothetical protein [Plebeiibacterium sediminum]|uniref:Cupin domain-containing protein n=1 Tax=Plebeiibacterium sediminum TaxID=2992112 RepID=A0AAE3M748_9BACT|nr:hypothetical protein [Plebeiobacterium sediminum]MCW3788516.1 hypothetical protein [Plebeiobacterium sediminum]